MPLSFNSGPFRLFSEQKKQFTRSQLFLVYLASENMKWTYTYPLSPQ